MQVKQNALRNLVASIMYCMLELQTGLVNVDNKAMQFLHMFDQKNFYMHHIIAIYWYCLSVHYIFHSDISMKK